MTRRVLTSVIVTALIVFGAMVFLSEDACLLVQPRSSQDRAASVSTARRDDEPPAETPDGIQTATFGSGCFWCTEAVFERLHGVESVVSGYSGGNVKNPSYGEVSAGMTGHAEVVQITYDSAAISFAELLEVFWKLHDPTTLNRQGADWGTQYRSVIFYHNDVQQKLAEHYKRKLDAAGIYSDPVVTEIAPFRQFFPAEDYHQNYFAEHGRQPYCRVVIGPKIDKLKKVFGEKVKRD